MKNVLVVLSLMILTACGPDLKPQLDKLEKENKKLKEIAGPLPASLDKYYPPKAPAPIYLIEMFALSGPFEGVGSDLQENDFSGAKDNFNAFKTQYQKMAVMVEEWKDKFPMQPIDTLGQALAGSDPAKIGKAMGEVGKVCASCHVINQVKAQQKYHWPDFNDITLTDPLTQKSISWHEYMMQMAGTFNGIGIDLKEEQLENARNNFKVFSNFFISMKDGCGACHTSDRAYFVDASIQNMVKDLGKAINATTPDAKAIEKLSGAIGNESCLKCHFVHMPSVNAKAIWKTFGDTLISTE